VRHEIVAEEEINPEFVKHYGAVYDRAMRVLYDRPYKLIQTSKGERLLFDLARDPDEAENLAAREPDRVQALERRLAATSSVMTAAGNGGLLARATPDARGSASTGSPATR
jgi:hypothetical protein